MSQLDTALREVSGWAGGAYKQRLESEMNYARRVSLAHGGAFDALILDAISKARECVNTDGTLTDAAAEATEEVLLPMKDACKAYRLLMVGHAHIDMNWMWRYDETVSITLDTFRTALNLMNEFPSFTFSQSQASTYRIVEQFEPKMLDEIRARIKDGQWEVSASTWVEADRNMPSAESVARHFLYTKNYLPKLLGISQDQLNLDFEPDTFGHGVNVPEMLTQAGVKYYYHCRGEKDAMLYRWRAPSGSEILVLREPFWYLGPIDYSMAEFVPDFCGRYGMDTAMRVYGVGDHGGGPTRRDIERIIEMGTWPIFPRVEFGRYDQFYAAADAARESIPVQTGEKNFIFTGCYTSQSRIKAGNARAERHLFEAEALSAFACLTANAPYDRAAFESAWRGVLFNQFHDIIPGSGVIDTREYAMGLYQEAYAAAATAKRMATAKIAELIDTRSLIDDSPIGTSEGAGVGFGVEGHALGQVERGGGKKSRVFHIFNALPHARRGVVPVVLWDFLEDLDRIEIIDENGKVVRHQLLDDVRHEYWQHQYTQLLIEADLPALGYATYGLRLNEDMPPKELYSGDMRLIEPLVPVLENELLRAEFNPLTGALISLIDKKTGREALAGGGARFMKLVESADRGMTSWTIGRYMSEDTFEDFVIRPGANGALRCALTFEAHLGSTKLAYTVSLDAGADALRYDVSCDWLEPGSVQGGLPQLHFRMQLTDQQDEFLSAVPGGTLTRVSMPMDVPSLHWIAAKSGAVLLSDTKYGFRGDKDEMGVTLLRSSVDPDPFPELGRHTFTLSVGISEAESDEARLMRAQAAMSMPIVISGASRSGGAPLKKSFMEVTGAVISGVKLAESEDALIVRGHEVNGKDGEVKLAFAREIERCQLVDTLERALPGPVRTDGNSAAIPVRANAQFTVKVTFA